MNNNMRRSFLCVVIYLCMCFNAAKAMIAVPTPVPADRLIANANSYIKENPNDAHGYYVLGRIHYLAFANKTLAVPRLLSRDRHFPSMGWDLQTHMYEKRMRSIQAREFARKELGLTGRLRIPRELREKFEDLRRKKIRELEIQDWKPPSDPKEQKAKPEQKQPDPDALILHAAQALRNFKKAIEMDPENNLYHLGLGSLLDQYVDYLREIALKEVPDEFSGIILGRAKDAYYRAYELSIQEDLKRTSLSVYGLRGIAGYEAGIAYLRLIETEDSLFEYDKEKAEKVSKNLEKIEGVQFGIMTPIVFTLERHFSPAELLGHNLQVEFDLDGDGNRELWPWVKPTTGILVWDPEKEGSITSGRQMFGSVTWWLFFNDGYHALNCLDDNRDGVLSGKELKGIFAWLDGNGNGKSERGEIKSLQQLQIISLSAESTGTKNGWPANNTGIRLSNGRTVPTYDWIAAPIDSPLRITQSLLNLK